MQIVEQAAIIGAPFAIVIDAVNDIEAIPGWATVKGSVDKLQDHGAGRRYNWHFQVSNFKFAGQLEVIEQTENSLITKTTGDIESIWTINLTPVGKNSTAIRVMVEYILPHTFVEPLADLVLQQLATPEVAQENMERFKAMVEERARVIRLEESLANH